MRKGVKLEIIVDQLNVPQIIKILEKQGLRSYTLFRGLTGSGEQGDKDGEGLSGLFTNAMVVVACEEHEALSSKDELEKFLNKIGGICMITSIQWFG